MEGIATPFLSFITFTTKIPIRHHHHPNKHSCFISKKSVFQNKILKKLFSKIEKNRKQKLFKIILLLTEIIFKNKKQKFLDSKKTVLQKLFLKTEKKQNIFKNINQKMYTEKNCFQKNLSSEIVFENRKNLL